VNSEVKDIPERPILYGPEYYGHRMKVLSNFSKDMEMELDLLVFEYRGFPSPFFEGQERNMIVRYDCIEAGITARKRNRDQAMSCEQNVEMMSACHRSTVTAMRVCQGRYYD